MTKPKKSHHNWEVVGRDYDGGFPNMWQCRNCKAVRSEASTNGDNYIIEFTDTAGEVLSRGLNAAPKCRRGAYK